MNAEKIRVKWNKPCFSRLLCLLSKDVEIAGLAKAQRSTDWLERAAVARHPNTPLTTLRSLVNDGNMVVRTLAQKNLEEKDGSCQ